MSGVGPYGRRFRVLVLHDSDTSLWVAQCVDLNLATQAEAFGQLMYAVQLMFAAHKVSADARGVDPWNMLVAPYEVRKAFLAAGMAGELAGWPDWMDVRMATTQP